MATVAIQHVTTTMLCLANQTPDMHVCLRAIVQPALSIAWQKYSAFLHRPQNMRGLMVGGVFHRCSQQDGPLSLASHG